MKKRGGKEEKETNENIKSSLFAVTLDNSLGLQTHVQPAKNMKSEVNIQ